MKLSFQNPVRSELKRKDSEIFYSEASLAELKKHIPEIDKEKNPDLLPISFNAFVANKANKNYDIINTDGAVSIAKGFVNKPINIEHDRQRTIGVITNYSYSEYGTNKEMTEEEASKTKKPFNIVLGGLIWKVVNKSIAEAIEDSSDPESEDYESISASWELSFEDYAIVATENGTDEMEGGMLIDGEDKNEYIPYMKHSGGKGVTKKESWSLYRMPTKNMVALGVGMTENPAADVKGICTDKTMESETDAGVDTSFITKEHLEQFREYNRTVEELKEKISKLEEKTVLNKEKLMIKRIKDISADSILASLGDQKVEESVASAISDIVRSAWNKESDEWNEQIKAEKAKQEEIEAQRQKAQDELEATKEKIQSLETELTELKNKEFARAKEEQFQTRMDYFDSEYQVSDKHRAVLAKKLQKVDSDEDFEELKAELDLFLPRKESEPKTQESKASVEDSDENSVSDSVDNALATTQTIPNTKASSSEDLKNRFAKSFQVGVDVTLA